MSFRVYTPFILAIVLIVAVFGMPIVMGSPLHHEIGCPFMPSAAICATGILEHVAHWQGAFAAIIFEILTLVAFALFCVRQWELAALAERHYVRIRSKDTVPVRPTLLQELCSRGLLNPKPY